MIESELVKYIQDRLLDMDPTLDVEAGSEAYEKVVAPILAITGSDFLSTDVKSLVLDRLWQENRVAVVDGDAIDDLSIKPLQMALEPLRTALAQIKTNQSFRNPSLISEEGAEDLAANFFVAKEEGQYARGLVRLYFKNVTFLYLTPATRFYTEGGLSFYPTADSSLSATQMAANKDGNLYYYDVLVQAEQAGSEYNVGKDLIKYSDGLSNLFKIANLRTLTGGGDKDSAIDLYDKVSIGLTERSLTTTRGIKSRLSEFSDIVDTITIGFGDPEMQRDIIKGSDEGHLFASGTALVLGQYIVMFNGYEDRGVAGDIRPVIGDTMAVNYHSPWYLGLTPEEKIEDFIITRILFSSLDAGFTGIPGIFVMELDRLPSQLSTAMFPWLPRMLLVKYAIKQRGVLTISDMPGGLLLPDNEKGIIVADDEVHVGGAFDTFIRPSSLSGSSIVLPDIADNQPLLSGHSLQTWGGSLAPNVVEAYSGGTALNWLTYNVEVGHVLKIETGLDQGVYKILAVSGTNLVLDTELRASQSGIKFKVLDAVDLDIVTPRQVKVPFGVYQATDLATQVGSPQVAIGVNAIAYGVEENDILEIYSGLSAGKYTVKSIDTGADGKILTLDRPLTTTGINLFFSIYTELAGIQLPLTRLTKMEILDAASQTTGITVPYAEPAMTMNRCCFTGSETLCEDDLGFVVPDLTPFEPVSEEGDYEGCYEPHEKCYELLTGFTNSKEVYKLDMTKAPSTAGETLGLYTSEDYLTKTYYWTLVAMGKIWVGDAEYEEAEDYTGGPWGFNWGMTTWGGEGDSGFPSDILLENWFKKEIIYSTAEPYEALGPFRVRRCYSDGCLECDGHVICICLDYNTQFEICLPNHLFDGCNNTFIGLPDINIADLLDTLEKAVYKQQIVSEYESYGYGEPYYGDYSGGYSYEQGYEIENEGVSALDLYRHLIPTPCLCESEPGDALTIHRGANAGSYIIEELHDVVIDVSLIFDDDSLDAVVARYGGIPLHICIAKIEGEFPLRTWPFLTELFEGPSTLKDLFGDYYGYIQDYVYTLFGSEQADTFADNIVWDWQEMLGSFKIPTHIGCGQDVDTDYDKWATYFANIQKEYQISDELMATVIVMLRRLNAFGMSSFGQALENEGWIPDGSGLDDEAFFLGGGLRFDNVTEVIEAVMDWLADPTVQQSDLADLLLKGGLLMWGTVLMLPFSVAYNIASEGNQELVPDKMIIDLNKVGDFVKELIFDTYSVGKTTCKNTVRMYFMEPTTIECEAALGKCYVGEDPHIPTLFATTVGETELLFSASSDVPPYELLPARGVDNEPVSPLDLPRAIRVRDMAGNRDQMVFIDPTLLTPIQYGIKPGIDELELYEQRFVLPAPQPNDGALYYLYTDYTDPLGTAMEYPNKYMIPGIITTSGSNIIRIPNSTIYGFTTNMVGDLLFIEQGPDTGGYRIEEVIDGKTALVNQPLTHDTLPIEAEGYRGIFYFGCEPGVGIPAASDPCEFADEDADFTASDVGKYITVFGCPVISYNGSWKITEYVDNHNVKLDISMGHFPEAVIVHRIGMWVMTLAPTSTPEVYDLGTETIAVVPYRQYYGEPTVFTITDVSHVLGSATNEAYIRLSTGMVDEYPSDGHRQPFAIVRPGLQKITSTQMAENEDGGLHYFDVEVVSLGSGEEFNLVEDSRFWPVRGTFKADGYLYNVADAKYSYSAYEEIAISISPSVLPVGSLDTPGARVQMVGSTIQLDYQYSPTVTNAHAFVTGRDVRPVCASPLVRQFLPAYPILDIEYEGGGTPQAVGDKIRDYVDTLSAMDVIQVDEIINIVKSQGASYVRSPLTLRALIFDLERKLTGIESQNQLASDDISREFFGSDRITYFNVPDNVSGLDTIPMGTRVYLKQIVRTGVFV